MKNPATHIQSIYVEKQIVDLPMTRRILERSEGLPVEIIDAHDLNHLDYAPYPDSMSMGKKHLLLCQNKGAFFKPCPATKEYRCCEYQVLNIGANCPMDCVYCILQAYLNNPWMTFYVNTEDLFSELTQAFKKEPKRFWRIGTGEFTDSMALDKLTGLSKELVTFMSSKKNAVLELKTKSAVIDNLEGLDHKGRTVLAWSLNSTAVMNQHEFRTATLKERLAAAKQCADWGYKLAFHFDPIIYHPDWKQGYTETIEALYDTVPAANIVWISLGALRYLPTLKQIATSRFPKSRFFYEEFIVGLDGKSRYFRPQRTGMYKHIYNQLKAKSAKNTCIYMCMESDEIWRDVFGYTPEEKGGLPVMLDRASS
nr:DNA photolyase [Desulfobulbaceae bacterium]